MKLRAWMAEDPKARSRGRLAKMLGVSQPTVSYWLKAYNRPQPHLRRLLVTLADIPEDDWFSEEERVAVAAGPVVPAPTGTETG